MRDLMNNIQVKPGIAPVVITDGTDAVSAIIDRKGYDSLTFAIVCGTLADNDATFTALLEESDVSNFATSNAVSDTDMIGTEALASFDFADDGAAFKIGYRGNKRYVRLTIVVTSTNSAAAPLAAVAILGHPDERPTANPPA